MTADNGVTISRPEDILGFIPHALGLWPKESLVAMTLRGQTLGATLRVDLPGERSDQALAAYARRIGGYLEADHGADGVLLAFFSDDGWDAGVAVPHGLAILEALEPVLAQGGLALRDAWFIGSEYWRSAFCTDADCCPHPGRPVDQIRDSRLNAEMVFRGSNVMESPRLLGPDDQAVVDPEFIRREDGILAELLRRWRSRKAFEDLLDVWTGVLDSDRPRDFDCEAAAFLRASLRVPSWRDAVVVLAVAGRTVACGGAEAFGLFEQEEDEQGALAVPPSLASPAPAARKRTPATDVSASSYGEVFLGLYPQNPDWKRLTRLDQVLAMLSRHGGGEARAASLTIRGWVQWCRGSGSFAHALLSQAESEQSGYRLAELLAEVVRRGSICGWAKSESSAWRKFGGAVA
ncbi:hypothetical protein GCM10027405_08660 [Arthrobacter alkaliphilus]|uniref:DUF4192 domain-containing protein n=1 Tax=Arthrobacter alkaliphilus TaxID=369936 RepID=UPI001F22AD92|nr:DUF4192 domain-containing protein [Arthrobacter alkaliphilus]